MRRILVTGAAGFIGSHTVDRLLAENCAVLGVDNFRSGHAGNLPSGAAGFSFEPADVAEEGVLDRLARAFKPQAIIHLAALVSVPESFAQPEENRRLNFGTTELVLRAARAAQVPRIVFASSAAVYGAAVKLPLTEDTPCAPLSPYGEAKLDSENLLLTGASQDGLVVRCHRYFNVYGPRQDPRSSYSGVISRFCDALAAGKSPVIFGDGEQTRDFVYVGDVARANAVAACGADVTSGVANICTGCAVSLNELLDRLADVSSISTPATHAPARAGDIRFSCGAPEKARRELGFATRTDLSAGLAELVRSLAQRGRA